MVTDYLFSAKVKFHVNYGINLENFIRTLHAAADARGRQGSLVPSSSSFFSISFHDQIKAQRLVAEIAEKVELEGMTEDYGKLEKELEKASPLAIINEALQKFIDCSAISFSGAKDVSLILQSGVFSLETGRWSSQNYKLSDDLERFYGMDIEYLHQECCRVLEVRRLGRCCQGNTRPAFPWQHERGGRRWWEEGKVMERGLHEGNIESEDEQIKLGPWLDVLYAPWRHFFQAMENSYAKLVDAEVKTGKFRVDGEHRAFANQKLQLRIFTTTVIFPGSKPIKYSSEKRDIDSQLAFVSSLQWIMSMLRSILIHLRETRSSRAKIEQESVNFCGEIDEFPFETSDFCGEIDEFPYETSDFIVFQPWIAVSVINPLHPFLFFVFALFLKKSASLLNVVAESDPNMEFGA
ncbi:hypothetical protein OIU84_016695 [Salix udensis]|uniref:Uncharacterized protein n=1 Tax=Salix udensis TaxID=889485 RepID=A0AAD6JA01_9ROSI|nr:hypothetical protein OIU84_016695 [Salix udensis]